VDSFVQSTEQQAAVELVRLAQEQGLSLTGPDGLLKQLTKPVLTDTPGHVKIDVRRDRAATFEPQDRQEASTPVVRVDEVVLSLDAKGLTTGEISVHLPISTGRRRPGRRSAGLPTR
jgi:hypothetical protein